MVSLARTFLYFFSSETRWRGSPGKDESSRFLSPVCNTVDLLFSTNPKAVFIYWGSFVFSYKRIATFTASFVAGFTFVFRNRRASSEKYVFSICLANDKADPYVCMDNKRFPASAPGPFKLLRRDAFAIRVSNRKKKFCNPEKDSGLAATDVSVNDASRLIMAD